MANDELARKEAGLVVVALAPDVCKSPSAPVPYQIVAYLSDDQIYSPNVNFDQQPAMRIDSPSGPYKTCTKPRNTPIE